jgi:hypothetical protein
MNEHKMLYIIKNINNEISKIFQNSANQLIQHCKPHTNFGCAASLATSRQENHLSAIPVSLMLWGLRHIQLRHVIYNYWRVV